MPSNPADHWEVGDLSYLSYREWRHWLRHPILVFRWWRTAKKTYGFRP